MTDPQALQTAINGATNAHTGLHQALHQMRHGSVTEAKLILVRQITVLASMRRAVVASQIQQEILRWHRFTYYLRCHEHL